MTTQAAAVSSAMHLPIDQANSGEYLDHRPAQSRPIRMLVIEDCEFDKKRLLRMCRNTGLNFEVKTIDSISLLRTALDSYKFDLIFVDFRLPDSDGIEAIRRIRAHPPHVTAAILMLTGQCDLTVAVEAMKEGCADYLAKNELTPETLRDATLNALDSALLQKQLMRARGLTDKLSDLMQDYARESSAEMKPIILRMMRLIRENLRGPHAARFKDAKALDAACRQLWAFV